MDVDDYRALVLQPRGLVDVLRRIYRVADIRQTDGRAVPVGNDQRLVGIGVHQLVGGVQHDRLVKAVERALGGVDRLRADGGTHILQRQTERGQPIRIEAHANRGTKLAMEIHQPDARHLRDLWRDEILGVAVHFGQRQRIGG